VIFRTSQRFGHTGATVNGKIAARYDFDGHFALRGAVASGFRAPSPQQEYVAHASTIFVAGNPAGSEDRRDARNRAWG